MIINVQKVKKHYQQGNTDVLALEDVSFTVNRGETVAITGPSGSGKTTLLAILAGLESPDSGEVNLCGSDLTKMTEQQLSHFRSKNIGIVFQQYLLMQHLTALENVELPLEILRRESSRQTAMSALSNVGLNARVDHMPHQLSGGECQRVAIARAFAAGPEILLADEPSGNLDTVTGKKVMDLLFALARERQTTMILITHDLELAQRCERQIHLSGGQIV